MVFASEIIVSFQLTSPSQMPAGRHNCRPPHRHIKEIGGNFFAGSASKGKSGTDEPVRRSETTEGFERRRSFHRFSLEIVFVVAFRILAPKHRNLSQLWLLAIWTQVFSLPRKVLCPRSAGVNTHFEGPFAVLLLRVYRLDDATVWPERLGVLL